MIATLAFRHLTVRKLRSLFLLLGFSLGVGVMIVLLSVGEAMLDQSRDISLVGGGEVTILPQGIDVEAMRTGGLSGRFFGIDRARFLVRQVLGGARRQNLVRTVSPAIEGKLLYIRHGNRRRAVRAGGEIPSRAYAVGAGLDVRSGHWNDSPADSGYVAPTRQQFYDQLDRFHRPRRPDSTWGEWHYFNLVTAPDEWWYITYLIGGQVPGVRPALGPRPESRDRVPKTWGGQLLVTHRRPDGQYDRFNAQVPSTGVGFDTSRADVTIGPSSVHQKNGTYLLRGRARGKSGSIELGVSMVPGPNRYFPPVELRDDDFLSGYVVPALAATASGKLCVASSCREFTDVPAYHDHNWGVWRDVTWEWGAARGSRLSLLYGGVYGPERRTRGDSAGVSPFFLALVDSLGVKQVLRFGQIRYQGRRAAAGTAGRTAPAQFSLVGTREADTVRLDVRVLDALATDMTASSFHRVFLQMRGRFTLAGQALGQTVADSGTGFFETYVTE